MRFQFHVELTEADYLEYNKFQFVRSSYGKKRIAGLRILVAVIFGFFALLSLFEYGFTLAFLFAVLMYLMVAVILQLLLTPFLALILKPSIKFQRKLGKAAYSPSSVIEFIDDNFAETTEVQRTELQYTAIERISIVENKMIYLHINHLMAILLPFASFESQKQYHDFLDFIKTKCSIIDFY